MPSEFQRKNELISVINDMEVNWADITPSLSSTFAPEDVPCLRTIVLAGEEVKKEHVERWAGKVRLINCYGPSECGGCTSHEYAGSDSPPDTIGRTLPCFKFWVVAEDDVNRLVSIGAVGELLVEGPTLARGYLNNESLTREAFIESPAWLPADVGASTRRFYRTKDLVQYRTDGSLKFVGRSDTQIKIRGQRVELGETENQLAQYYGLAKSTVAKSMVAFPKTGKYANQLVAVIELCDKETTYDVQTVKLFMKGRLPEYMIPSVWLAIDKIPLSTSIKVDRRQIDHLLVGLDSNDTRFTTLGSHGQSQFPPLLPLDALAHTISVKVAELLASRNSHGLESLIGYDFRLSAYGFDSIQAITLRIWMKKQFGANIPISKLTSDTLTISGLVDLINYPLASISTISLVQEVEAMYTELHACEATRPDELTSGAKIVFLTGATGYLGRKILDRLVSSSEFRKIFLLIRCKSQEEGFARIAEVAGKAILRYPERIEIWPGDLQQIRLGLTDAHWKTLSEQVDVIIHNGAVVRWNVDYETLKKANVLSTVEILKALLKSSVAKSFIYVSGGQQLTPGEDDDAANVQRVMASSGYAQSKLASELLVKYVAVSRLGSHHSFSVIKPSYIIGSIQDGIANTTDYLWRLVAGAIEIEAYGNDELDNFVYLSDVETVARSTISAALEPSICPKVRVIKILDGVTLADFWQIVREAGYQLRAMPSEQWWNEMWENVQRGGEKHCLWPLMWMLEDRQRSLGVALGSQSGYGSDADLMRSHIKAAVARNLMWLRQEKALPGF
jgi:thioester reductase-like protein